jgi:MOSC domain-containing protein YiiM
MRLQSINVGKPIQMEYQGKPLETGIFKQPVEGPVALGRVNLAGDGQADLIHHGGEDKAVCVYPAEHYSYWEKELGRELGYGAFGENFTLEGCTEEQVNIGDIFEIGDAVVQVSQPRQPCFKLGKKHNRPELVQKVQTTGYTGYYFRVLQEGTVEAGQTLYRRETHPLAITIAEANRLHYVEKDNVEGIKRLLQNEALSASWREGFESRLRKLTGEEPV